MQITLFLSPRSISLEGLYLDSKSQRWFLIIAILTLLARSGKSVSYIFPTFTGSNAGLNVRAAIVGHALASDRVAIHSTSALIRGKIDVNA